MRRGNWRALNPLYHSIATYYLRATIKPDVYFEKLMATRSTRSLCCAGPWEAAARAAGAQVCEHHVVPRTLRYVPDEQDVICLWKTNPLQHDPTEETGKLVKVCVNDEPEVGMQQSGCL